MVTSNIEMIEKVAHGLRDLIEYLHNQYNNLLVNTNIREIIYCALPYRSEEENIDEILQMMNEILLLRFFNYLCKKYWAKLFRQQSGSNPESFTMLGLCFGQS